METLIYITKSASILSLFYLVYIMVLRKDTLFSTYRHYLTGGIITSILLPLVVFTKTVYKDVPISKTLISYNINPIIETSSLSIDWWKIISIVYLVGIIFMSLRFLKQLFSLFNLIRNNSYSKINGFRYIKLDENINPFSFFKYIVYNPEKHSEKELKMILKHEQTHAFQLHSIDIILSNIILIIQWMNPFAWLYKKSIEENLEFIADSETVQQIDSKKEYQLSMLRVFSSNSLQPVLVNNFYQSLIKKRIIMLHKNQTSTKNQWKLLLILPLLGVFLWSFNVEEEVKYNDFSLVEPSIVVSTENPSLKEENLITEVSEKNNNKSIDSKITVTIDKNTTDEELEKLKKLFKDSYDVTLKFSGIKRNSAEEIIKIKVIMKSKNSSANFDQDDSEGINEFSISFDDDNGSISIGNSNNHDLHFISKKGNGFVYEIEEDTNGNIKKRKTKSGHKIKDKKHDYILHEIDEDHESGNVIHLESESGKKSSVWVTKEGNHIKKGSQTVIIESNDDNEDENVFILKSNDKDDEDSVFIHKTDDNGFFFVGNDGKNPLIYIDGKKSTKEEMENLDSDVIKNIEILKGDKVIKEYGKKAKDGVILITTNKD